MEKRHRFSCDEIVQLLQAKQQGQGWVAQCPAHDDSNPSLSICRADNGPDVLLKCFAGCDFHEIIRAIARISGRTFSIPSLAGAMRRPADNDVNAKRALQIWQASHSLAGSSCAKTYFENRGLIDVTSPALRFHPYLRHPTGQTFPALLAKVADLDGNFLALHRTYLSPDGSRKALVDPNKMMLGNLKDGAVHLAEPVRVLMLGEGLETCLSAMQAVNLPAWAALSASRIPKINLPICVEEIIILADNDNAGAAAAVKAARRWRGEGRRVRIARPPGPGQDFNDMLRGRVES